jgi:hypothetical protein
VLTRALRIALVVTLLGPPAALVLCAGQAAAPTLTEIQRLQIQNLSQKLEIAQLRAQAAQRDFDAAREQLTALLQTLTVDGYDLDVSTLTYRPKPTPQPGHP